MKKEDVEKLLHDKVEAGEHVSPVLPEGIKNYLIDIDGTVCDDIPNEEPERMLTAQVYPDALTTLNRWFDEGHVICFFTSRTETHREYTEIWLKKHGFRYHDDAYRCGLEVGRCDSEVGRKRPEPGNPQAYAGGPRHFRRRIP